MATAAEPLRLQTLRQQAWRNLHPGTWQPGPQFNVLSGANGAGKSNVLEAVAYLGFLRSFRGAKSEHLQQQPVAPGKLTAVQGHFRCGNTPIEAQVHWSAPGVRRPLLDGKRPQSFARWSSRLPMVIFHPASLQVVSGGPELRRLFLDRLLALIDPAYSSIVTHYQRALRGRNRLLKDGQAAGAQLHAFDQVLAEHGVRIVRRRQRLCEHLAPRVDAAFADIVGELWPLQLHYESRVEDDIELMVQALRRQLGRDKKRGYTSVGPHSDELRLNLKALQLRQAASQGQQRAVVLALKLAELNWLRRSGHSPILLLDDVTSELDARRSGRLFARLAQEQAQVFITTTHPELVRTESATRHDFTVSDGMIS
ncbi:MAG: DNA replication/repair protein RecF [Polyangiales bacterium]